MDTTKNFLDIIEDYVWEKDCSYTEAVLSYCSATGTEIEVVAKMVTGNLKHRLTEENEKLFLLKKPETEHLPLV